MSTWWLVDQSRASRGSTTLEFAVLAPGLLLLIGVVIVAGRLTLAQGAVEVAARNGARQASIARSATDARTQAEAMVTSMITQQGLGCSPSRVAVDTAGFEVPVGEPAQVSVTVSCTVALSDVGLPMAPGSKELTASFSEPLDSFRSRTG